MNKVFDFGPTKLRALAKCSSCGAVRGVYSVKKVGCKGGPTEEDMANFEQWKESTGYICECEIKGQDLLYSRRAQLCGQSIEANYYNPPTGTKGGRIITKDICSVCYIDADLMTPNEIRTIRNDLNGRTPLILCRACARDSSVTVPCSGARKNIKHAKQQQKEAKKRKLDEAVKSGRRKPRSG